MSGAASRLVKILTQQETSEFGFGNTGNGKGQRILNKDGSANIIRKGDDSFTPVNIYHSLITMSWWKFMLLILFYYIIINFLFTLVYFYLTPNHLAGMIFANEFERFEECFFFSAQSLTTVGYGRINPVGLMASSIASLEALIGLLALHWPPVCYTADFHDPQPVSDTVKIFCFPPTLIPSYRRKRPPRTCSGL